LAVATVCAGVALMANGMVVLKVEYWVENSAFFLDEGKVA
jgi:hypothetical protein